MVSNYSSGLIITTLALQATPPIHPLAPEKAHMVLFGPYLSLPWGAGCVSVVLGSMMQSSATKRMVPRHTFGVQVQVLQSQLQATTHSGHGLLYASTISVLVRA